jgi:hypothetical protein
VPDDDDPPGGQRPPPGTPVAGEPDDAPDWPLTADRVPALLPKIIG